MYLNERKRTELKSKIGSIEEWLKTLKICVKIEELNDSNLPRAAQLLNKTNQMNLSTRRLSESELSKWVADKNRKLWTFRVSDKFGDSGLSGIISIEKEGDKARIVDYVLSCRVFGRKIEEAMLHVAIEYTSKIGVSEIYGKYKETAKNKPCFDFWISSGFIHNLKTNIFKWPTEREYPVPEQLKLLY